MVGTLIEQLEKAGGRIEVVEGDDGDEVKMATPTNEAKVIAGRIKLQDKATVIAYLSGVHEPPNGKGRAEKKEIYEDASAVAWSESVEPLTDGVPAFPVDIFPNAFRDFCEAVAEGQQVPTDLVAMFCLAAISTAIAKKFTVHIPSKDNWREPVNLYLCCVLDVGNRKSPALKRCAKPIWDYERELQERLGPEVRRHNQERQILIQRIEALKKKAANAKREEDCKSWTSQSYDVLKQLEEMPPRCVPSFLVDDSTPQSLERMMHENDGRIATLSAEGGVFDIMAGRWSKSHELDSYLKAHAGDPIKTHRIHRDTVSIHNPAITFGLSVQPEKLQGIAADRKFSGLGMLARFLYFVPTSIVGSRQTRPRPVSETIEANYRDALRDLLDMPIREFPKDVRLTSYAEEMHDEFQREIEPRLGRGGDLDGMHGWPSKLVGHALRIAACLHFARCGQDGEHIEIDVDSMEPAIRLCQGYLVEHAAAAFRLSHIDSRAADATWIWSWAKRNEKTEFNVRDLKRSGKRRFQDDEERVRDAIEMLCQTGYLARLAVRSTGGRTPSPRFAVRPD